MQQPPNDEPTFKKAADEFGAAMQNKVDKAKGNFESEVSFLYAECVEFESYSLISPVRLPIQGGGPAPQGQ